MNAYSIKKQRRDRMLAQVDVFLRERLSPISTVQAARRHQSQLVLARYYEKKAREA